MFVAISIPKLSYAFPLISVLQPTPQILPEVTSDRFIVSLSMPGSPLLALFANELTAHLF
jgi:hypothetical protein